MKSIVGNFYKFIGKTLEVTTSALIQILELIVLLIDSVKKLLSIFSILLIFFIFNPFLFSILILNPWILLILIILFIVPLLGKGLINYLKYLQYISTEYFYDKADFYLLGRDHRKGSFGEYSQEYFRKREEERREESRRRAEETQRMWEEMFRNYYENMNNQNYGGPFQDGGYQGGYYTGSSYRQSSNNGSSYYNPTHDFIKKYEDACKTLEISPTADKYAIKLAYRKMAKKYHPDINKASDATEKFQKINEANEFFSEGNIERYAQLQKNKNFN